MQVPEHMVGAAHVLRVAMSMADVDGEEKSSSASLGYSAWLLQCIIVCDPSCTRGVAAREKMLAIYSRKIHHNPQRLARLGGRLSLCDCSN